MTSHLTHAEPTPPFPKQEQESPGREAEMRPLADHGEDSYVGQGRLKDILIDGSRSPAPRAARHPVILHDLRCRAAPAPDAHAAGH